MSDELVPESNAEIFSGYAYILNAVTTNVTATGLAAPLTLTFTDPDKQTAGIIGARVNFDNGAINVGTNTLYWGPTAAVAFTANSTGTSETTSEGITGTNKITTKPIAFVTGGGQITLGGLNASISGGAAYENFTAETSFNTLSSTSATWAKWAPTILGTVGYRRNVKSNVYAHADISYYNVFENFAVTGISTDRTTTTTYNQGDRQVYSATGGATYYF